MLEWRRRCTETKTKTKMKTHKNEENERYTSNSFELYINKYIYFKQLTDTFYPVSPTLKILYCSTIPKKQRKLGKTKKTTIILIYSVYNPHTKIEKTVYRQKKQKLTHIRTKKMRGTRQIPSKYISNWEFWMRKNCGTVLFSNVYKYV